MAGLNSIAVPPSLKNVKLHNLMRNHSRRQFNAEQQDGQPRSRIIISNLRGDKCAKYVEAFKAKRPSTAPAVVQNHNRRVSLKPAENAPNKWKRKKYGRRRSSIPTNDRRSSRGSIPSSSSENSNSMSSLPKLPTPGQRPMTASSLYFPPANTRQIQLSKVKMIMERFKLKGIVIDERFVERAILDPQEIVHTVTRAPEKVKKKKKAAQRFTAEVCEFCIK